MKKFFTTLTFLLLGFYVPVSTANEGIISAGSSITELIVALGQEKKLVAIDQTSQISNPGALPSIGYHRRLSAEGMLALNADQLIGSNELGPATTLNQLRAAGMKVEVVNTEPTAEGLLERIDQIAKLTNATQNAKPLKKQVTDKINQLKQSHSQIPKKKILFLLIHQGRPANVAGANTTPNAIIELAGGINPAAASIESYKPISTEAMVEMQPDIILISGRNSQEMGGADYVLKKMPLLAATPAGKNKQFIVIDGHALVGGLGLNSLSEAFRINKLIQ
ncbi:ABC transporter substrate-binding protein [Vibrio caribbeanicus]|nr:ABC transporter substrate-binding protein [Vibrio caribbeanicus]MCY9844058.1 ABC transporter substrate-binding protein [Vibrio caribbeanicus]